MQSPLAALWGPSPVNRASGRCLDVVRVLRITQGAPAVEAVTLRSNAVVEALRGRTEAALRVRVSLHTGEARERGGDFYGPTLNRCARLLDTAHGGQVLLSSACSARRSSAAMRRNGCCAIS